MNCALSPGNDDMILWGKMSRAEGRGRIWAGSREARRADKR